MNVIENFAALSEKEQREFAEALVKTINSESSFTADTDFEIESVEVYEHDGSLLINANTAGSMEVRRAATWTCKTSEDAEDDPGYGADYEESIYKDVKNAFKTTSVEIDGYTVTVDIADVDEEETAAVEVQTVTEEDSGIGSYDYFGFTGIDSHPYVAVEGTIVKECKVYLGFFVEPAAEVIDSAPDEE